MNDQLREKVLLAIKEAKSIVIGQEPLIKAVLGAIINDGHLLIEGVPGIGKTLTITTIARLCDLTCRRIQFTADLLPSDLIGTMIFSPKNEDFKPKFGPIFTQLLLADEINRAPAKVQSALLEAMEEGQVTIGEKSYRLSKPFVVLATQNPIEQEGTYPLPEAQMDRFMMKVNITTPSYEDEKKILDFDRCLLDTLKPVLSTDDFLKIKKDVEAIYVDDKIRDLILNIVHATRPGDKLFNKKYEGAIKLGASPRGSINLFKSAKYMAFLEGKEFVTPEQVLQLVGDVLGHRVMLSYDAIIDGINSKDLIREIAEGYV